MIFIKLTNRHQKYLGMPVYININQIYSIYEEAINPPCLTTVLWGGNPQNMWYVEESPSEIVKQIKEVTNVGS